jgi:hypothetical protein
MSNNEDDDWLAGMSNNFRARFNQRRRLTRMFHTLVEKESGGDYKKYAQLVVGLGRMFDYGEFGRSIRLQGLEGSPQLEKIRMEIAMLPPLPPPSNMKKPQTGGKKRRATKKARRNNRRVSRRNK